MMESQSETTLVELIRYNNWANAQVFAACLKLTPEQVNTAAPGTYGTIRATIEHIIQAEADYIGRLTGARPQPPFQWGPQVPLTSLVDFANTVAVSLLDTIQRISPNQIVHEEEDGNTLDYQARFLFIQVIDHGVEHRTNITTILSGMGLPDLEVDGWAYLWTHPERFKVKTNSQSR